MAKVKIRPLGAKVLVKRVEAAEITAGANFANEAIMPGRWVNDISDNA